MLRLTRFEIISIVLLAGGINRYKILFSLGHGPWHNTERFNSFNSFKIDAYCKFYGFLCLYVANGTMVTQPSEVFRVCLDTPPPPRTVFMGILFKNNYAPTFYICINRL